MNMPTFPIRISKNPVSRLRLILLLALIGVLPGAAGAAEGESKAGGPDRDEAPRVVVTYYPLYIFTLNIMRGLPAPSLLLEPAGGCAHGLALRPSQVAALGKAEIIIETGLGLEPFLDSGQLPLAQGTPRISAAQLIAEEELIPLSDEHDHGSHIEEGTEPAGGGGHDRDASEEAHAHEHEHEHVHAAHGEASTPKGTTFLWGDRGREGFNGHAWSSPRLAGKMTQAIGEALAEYDPARAAQYRRQANAYAAELYQIAEEIRSAGLPLRGSRVVLSHTSLAYLARELELDVVATLRDEDENEPGPRGLGRIIRRMQAEGVDAVLFDPQAEGRLATLVARESGCENIIELNPASAGMLKSESYGLIMRKNIETIAKWAEATGKAQAAGERPLAGNSGGNGVQP